MILAAICLVQGFSAPMAKTELVASSNSVVPGKTYQIALHMTMASGWHSYFLNPGESGQATSIKWHLPQGWKAGPIRWPVPERIVIGGVAQYVYQNEVWLVTDITPPSQPWATGRPQLLKADVNWLLCREACVPQNATVSIPIYEGFKVEPNPAFEPARRAMVGAGVRSSAVQDGKGVKLTVGVPVSKTKGVEFFPGDATYFGADLPKVERAGTGINVVVPMSKYAPSSPKRLTGILVLPGEGAHWIDVPVTKR